MNLRKFVQAWRQRRLAKAPPSLGLQFDQANETLHGQSVQYDPFQMVDRITEQTHKYLREELEKLRGLYIELALENHPRTKYSVLWQRCGLLEHWCQDLAQPNLCWYRPAELIENILYTVEGWQTSEDGWTANSSVAGRDHQQLQVISHTIESRTGLTVKKTSRP